MARTTFSGPVVSQNGFIQGHQPTSFNAVNTTGTASAAQVADGYITSTSVGTVTITLPTGTDLGTAIGASRGTVLDLFVDNTAGASVVTVAANTNAVLSSAGVDGSTANFGDLTIAAGATGLARFTLMFSSAIAYTFSRTA